jgi:Pvc16 N-terminal domain
LATNDAIAFLGDTILSLVQSKLNPLVLPANVILSTPEEFKSFAPNEASVTIFLYQVGINGEMRNTPRRSLANGAKQRPPLPLEVRFLLTPWTKKTRDAYRIIGAIAQLFYDQAVLGFSELLGEVWAPDDTVEIVMESLPVEEHYDIWEPTDIPYRLSLAYLARVIGIESAISTVDSPVAVATFPVGAP